MSRPATRSIVIFVLGLLLAPLFSIRAESAGTTRSRLTKLGEDLVAAWTDFPKDNQKTVRDQRITDVNTQFSRDVNALDVPPTVTVQKALDYYINNVNNIKQLLKLDKMQAERTSYANSCGAVLRREVLQASDFKAPRTTQQCYQMLMDALVAARDSLHSAPNDIRQSSYQSINGVFADLFRVASIPEKPDPTTQMDLNIKEARKRFPTTSPDLEASNKTLYTMMEAAAKTIEQQAATHGK
jgi:hypothetical protein